MNKRKIHTITIYTISRTKDGEICIGLDSNLKDISGVQYRKKENGFVERIPEEELMAKEQQEKRKRDIEYSFKTFNIFRHPIMRLI